MDKETGPATEAPSANAAGDEAARLFGEEPPGKYVVDGRLIRIYRLPVGDLGLLTVGFRITDRPGEKWTRRFNRFKYGEPTAAKAATRTFCAAFEGFRPAGNPRVVVVSSVSSGQNIVQSDTPASTLAYALAQSRGWKWLPHHVTKDRHPRLTGIASAAERDATVDGAYLAAPIGGEPGLVIVVDDFCTRGATLADIARAIRDSNPGWEVQPASLGPVTDLTRTVASQSSAEAQVTTLGPAPAPTGLTLTPAPPGQGLFRTIAARWNAVEDGSPSMWYRLRWRKADQTPEAAWTTSGAFSGASQRTSTLDEDGAYDVQVASDNGINPIAWSEIKQATVNHSGGV